MKSTKKTKNHQEILNLYRVLLLGLLSIASVGILQSMLYSHSPHLYNFQLFVVTLHNDSAYPALIYIYYNTTTNKTIEYPTPYWPLTNPNLQVNYASYQSPLGITFSIPVGTPTVMNETLCWRHDSVYGQC